MVDTPEALYTFMLFQVTTMKVLQLSYDVTLSFSGVAHQPMVVFSERGLSGCHPVVADALLPIARSL